MENLARFYELLRQSRLAEAQRLLDAMLRDFPEEPEVHRAHASLAQSRGKMDAAVGAMQDAVALAPGDARLQLDLGQAHASAGQMEGAVAAFRRAVEMQSTLTAGWFLLGISLYGLRRETEALAALQRAHELAPHDPQTLHALAETHYALEYHGQALVLYDRLERFVGDFTIQLRRSQCVRRLGEPLRALGVVRSAVERFPSEAQLWAELGRVYEDLGDAAKAQEAYERAHALSPEWADPIGSAILLMRATAPEDLVLKAEALAIDAGAPPQQRAFLHYVLGKRADADADYAKAAMHWSAANSLRRAQDGTFDRADFVRKLDAATRVFTGDLLRRRRDVALRDGRPMFVVGMPRSGTTLVEQILAAHPLIHGCGERTGIVEIASSVEGETGMRWPEEAAKLDTEWCRKKASAYLGGLAEAASTALRLVDKQPYNFLHIGLIGLLFADARIVWCRRDSRDIALSIFSENFSPAASYATDLEDIRFVIEGQGRLMRYWQSASPLPILEVSYEALVTDAAGHVRRILEFADMPWDDACLAFHEGGRSVQTPSRWQVRQPVHARSVGRWRNYPHWFGKEWQGLDTSP